MIASNKHSQFIAAVLAIFLLSACSKDEKNGNDSDGRVALKVTKAGISAASTVTNPDEDSPATRATDDAWQAGDAIGIILLEAGTNIPTEEITACKYITSTTAGNFSPADKDNTAYYPTQEQAADVLAFYPYREIDTDLLIPVSTADQTTLSQIDLMVADKSTDHSATRPDVSLNFRHKLVKLVITVDREASAEDVDLTAGAKITLRGTATSAQWNLADATLTATGTATDISLLAVWNTAKQQLEATAIVLPTTAGAGVTLIVSTDKKTFEAPLSAGTALVEGTVNTLRVHLRQTEAIIDASVTDWTTGVTTDLETLPIDVTATDGNAAGISNLTLWTASAPASKAQYTFDATTAKWNSPTPFYLENLTANETFFARHTPMKADGSPVTDAVSGLADVLGNTTAAAISDGGIRLELKHLYAKLNIALLKGTDFPATVSTAGATLTLRGFKQDADINDKNVVTVEEGTSDTYTLSLDDAGNASLIVAPQSIAAGSNFTVQLKNTDTALNTYTATLTEVLALEGGKIHTLTLTLMPTTPSLNASVADWTTGAQDEQAIVIDGITDGNGGISGSGYTPADGDQLTIACGTSATYTYSSTSSSWSSLAPLYWDALAQTSTYTFNALLTPADAGTPEKDYLAGNTDAAFGTAINFSGDNALTHLMSRLNIILKPGTGYTAEDMKRAEVSLLKGYSIIETAPTPEADFTTTEAATNLRLAHATEAESDKDNAILNTLTLCPQTWTQGIAIFIVQMKQADGTDGSTYTVRATAEGGFTMIAGKEQTITATISKSGISLTFAVVPWGSGSHIDEEGDLEDPAGHTDKHSSHLQN